MRRVTPFLKLALVALLAGGLAMSLTLLKAAALSPTPETTRVVKSPAVLPKTRMMPALTTIAATINITATGFEPDQATIQAGETVAWVNQTGQWQRVIGGRPQQLYLPLVLRQAGGTNGAGLAPALAGELGLPATVEIAGLPVWESGAIAPGGDYTRTFTTPGVYPFYLAGQPSKTGRVMVEPAPDFLLEVIPPEQNVSQDRGVTYTVAISAIYGFNQAVSLTISNLPGDTTASWSENPVTPTTRLTLTLSTARTTPTGTFTATVRGESGPLSHSRDFSLTVQWPVCKLYPIMVPLSKLNGRQEGDQTKIGFNRLLEITPGTFTFVKWQAEVNNSNVNLEDDLVHPSNAGANYTEPDDPADTVIDEWLDWVESLPGAPISTALNDELNVIQDEGEAGYFPVWNDLCSGAECDSFFDISGPNGKYKFYTFVAMKMNGVYLYGNNTYPQCGADGGTDPGFKKCLVFEFSSWAPDHCLGNGY